MRDFKFSEIRKVMQDKGYTFFEKGKYNLNLIGIRSSNSKSDQFDDSYNVIYKNFNNQWKHLRFPFTSDPGKHWLTNPLNNDGTAILIPNQYLGVYQVGIHGRSWASGGYQALEQIKPMEYVRDWNKDDVLDFNLYQDPKLRIQHAFKANIKSNTHRASQWKKVLNVGKYSAACQVMQDPEHFKTLMALANKSADMYGNKLTYTLLEEQDFDV